MADEGLDLGAAEEAVDTGVESVDADLGTENVEVESDASEGDAEGQQRELGGSEPKSLFANGKFSPEAQAKIDKLKAEDPAFAKQISRAIREVEGYRRALPQGLREVKELRAHVEKLGGLPGIEETVQDLAFFRDLD